MSVCVPFMSLSIHIYIYMSVIFMPTDVRCKYPDTYLPTPFWMTTIFTLNIVIFVVFVSTCIGKTLFCIVHLSGNFFFSFLFGAVTNFALVCLFICLFTCYYITFLCHFLVGYGCLNLYG